MLIQKINSCYDRQQPSLKATQCTGKKSKENDATAYASVWDLRAALSPPGLQGQETSEQNKQGTERKRTRHDVDCMGCVSQGAGPPGSGRTWPWWYFEAYPHADPKISIEISQDIH